MTRNWNRNKETRRMISALLGANASVKCIIVDAMEIQHISFYNQGAAAFTSAATVKNGVDTVASSSATLAADTAEEKEGVDLANTSAADGATITLQAGDQPTYIVVTLSSDWS